MDQNNPLVRDAFPDLTSELITLLEAEGEHELTLRVRDVPLVAMCDCGDDFCQSIRTADHPKGQPYGEGHRTVQLSPGEGTLNLDVVHDRIMYIEVLNRAPMHDHRGPRP